MPEVDVKRLAAEISVQHGIRVDPDDPIMAVVTLNRLVLEQAMGEVVKSLQSATRDLHDAAEKVQLRAGIRLAKDLRECVATIREELRRAERTPRQTADACRANPTAAIRRRWVLELFVAVLLFLIGVGVGLSLRTP